jgi:hypothetical protein
MAVAVLLHPETADALSDLTGPDMSGPAGPAGPTDRLLPSPWPRPPLRLVGGDDARRPDAPWRADDLRVLARPVRRTSARVRRRRVLVAGVAVATVLVAVPVGSLLGRATPGGQRGIAAVATSALPTSTRAAEGTFYVVRPGDTLASIARRIQPSDPGPVAAGLAARLGSDRVVPGEHVPLT